MSKSMEGTCKAHSSLLMFLNVHHKGYSGFQASAAADDELCHLLAVHLCCA